MNTSCSLESALSLVAADNNETISSSAKRIGMPYVTLYKITKGRRPDIETVRKFCTEFAKNRAQAKIIFHAYVMDEAVRCEMGEDNGIIFDKPDAGDTDERLIKAIADLSSKNEGIADILEYLRKLYPAGATSLPDVKSKRTGSARSGSPERTQNISYPDVRISPASEQEV